MSGTGDGRRFDPRFDPAFQPGYDPRNDPNIAARTDPFGPDSFRQQQPLASTEAPAVPRPNPSPPPARLDVPEALASSRARGRRASVELADEYDEPDAEPAPRGVNPFLIALWVLSVVLVVGGIAIYRSIPGLEAAVGAGEANVDLSYFRLSALGAISAALIGVGLAAAAGALALHAARWTGRRSRRSDLPAD